MIPPELLNTITTGDARELAKRIPDNSVDLIFTDPVYDRMDDYKWLVGEGSRLLRQGGSVLAFSNAKWVGRLLAGVPTEQPLLSYVMTSGASPMNGRVIAKTHYVAWWGSERIKGYMPDGYIGTTWSSPNMHNHRWTKSPKYLAQILNAFTNFGAVVLDPFCGGGSVAAMCKMLGRQYIAFEIDPDTAQRARLRVEQTQMPLPGLEVEQQAEMEGIA